MDNLHIRAEIHNKSHQNKLEWIEDLQKCLYTTSKPKETPSFLNPQINWVYGFRSRDLMNSLAYHNDSHNRGTSEKILYVVSRIVVIFLHRLEEQLHYLEHKNEISSIVSSSGQLVATGEFGNSPSIHIWDINTLKTVSLFSGHHKSDIYLLMFSNEDKHLISCSLREPTPLFIFDLESKNLIFTFHLEGFVRGIVPIHSEVNA